VTWPAKETGEADYRALLVFTSFIVDTLAVTKEAAEDHTDPEIFN